MLDRQANQRADYLVAAVLTFMYSALLLATTDIGFPRDESFYFHAAYQYVGWFEELWANLGSGNLDASFTKVGVDKHWSYNPEHPVLMKASFALSWKWFHDLLGWMLPSTAMRLPAMLLGAGTVGLTYLFARPLGGRVAGVVAACCIALQPRFFFHAHLACFDVPITFMWLATVYAYWRSFDSRRWLVGAGIVFGLALSTKLNAFFLPIVLGGHWAIVKSPQVLAWWRGRGDESAAEDKGARPILPRPWVFVSMGLLGPLLFLGLWPRHWFDTFARIEWYMTFHLKHVHYFVYYFGENLQQPPHPLSYPWVMTLITVPATILLAAAIGSWALRPTTWRRVLGEDGRGTLLLLVVNLLFPIALISQPDTPIFGGTKHWMPAMPFLAIFAGVGVAWALNRAAEWRSDPAFRGALAGVLAAAVLGPAAYATAENHPFGTSYYNELIGSYRGAADARMFRQFWGYTSRQALPWLNEHAPKGARIDLHNTTPYSWQMYKREGLRRDDLRASPQRGSDYSLYHHQKGFVFRLIETWESYDTRAPSHVVDIDGVPVMSVYERPGIRRDPPSETPR
jgi:4-amino-4-deoxy-L-arabinose transferase-like glycosyltransferase